MDFKSHFSLFGALKPKNKKKKPDYQNIPVIFFKTLSSTRPSTQNRVKDFKTKNILQCIHPQKKETEVLFHFRKWLRSAEDFYGSF